MHLLEEEEEHQSCGVDDVMEFLRPFRYLQFDFMDSWRKNLYILAGTQFIAMMGMNLVVPFLPFFIRELGVSDPKELARWSGLVFAGTFMTAFIATPLWGSLGDKYGRKLMVIRAIFGLGISQLFVGLSQNVEQLLLFRLLQGALSGFIASTLALVTTATPRKYTGYALGVLQSATAGGTVFGPLIGGVLADLIGYREIFFVVSAICFVGGFIVIKTVYDVQETNPTGSSRSDDPKGTVFSPLHNFRLMFTNRHLRVAAFAIVLAQLSVQMIEPVFALFMEKVAGEVRYLSTLTGSVFAVAGVAMVIAAPWWGKRHDQQGIKGNLILALAGTGVAYSLHVVVPSILALTALRALLGFARGGILPALYSFTNAYAPTDRKSGMIGIASSLTILGNMLGPLLGGMVGGHFGINASFAVSGVLLVLTGGMVWKFLVEPRRTPTADDHALTEH